VLLHPDRTLEWITPTGHRYRSRPVDHRPPETTPTSPPADTSRRSLDELFTDDPPDDPDDPPPF
jgi:hypothetical protein